MSIDNNMPSEKLSAATPARALCHQCSLYKNCRTPFMRPFVPVGWKDGKRILLVGEAPGQHEDEVSHRPFTGKAGKLLRVLIISAGYDPRDVAFVNAIRCRPPNNKTPTMGQIRACRPFLLRVIELLKPSYILGLGGTALRAFYNDGKARNVTEYRGKALEITGVDAPSLARVRVTYHPAAVLHGAVHLQGAIFKDLRRLSLSKAVTPPSEVLPIRPTGLDTEFAPTGAPLTIGIANNYVAMAEEINGPRIDEIKNVLSQTIFIDGHNIPTDIDCLLRAGVPVNTTWISGSGTWDSLLLAKLIDENKERGAYKLENLFLSYFDFPAWKAGTEKLGKDATLWTPQQRVNRCRLDAWATTMLVAKLRQDPELNKIPPKYVQYLHKLQMTLHRVFLSGAAIDLKKLDEIKSDLLLKIERSKALLLNHAASYGITDFSPTRDQQVRKLLFKKLGLKPVSKTTTGLPSVGKYTLERYKDNPIVALVQEFRKANKVYSTWIENRGLAPSLRDLIVPYTPDRGWFPFRINPMGTKTHRRSGGGEGSKNPQNWPSAMRNIVVSRFPGGKILSVDYSRLEVILMAWVAEDEKLFEYFYEGSGYIGIAKELFKMDVEKDSPQYKITKMIVLGTDYGMQAPKLARMLWNDLSIKLSSNWDTHLQKSKKLLQKYFELFPGVKKYLREARRKVIQDQYIVAPTGAIRHLPCPDGADTPGFWHIEHQAANFPIQHLASVVTGAAMLDIERAICDINNFPLSNYHLLLLDEYDIIRSTPEKIKWGRIPRIINEVHDELVFDLPEKFQEYQDLITSIMQSPPTLQELVSGLPKFKLDIRLDERWG